MGNRLPEWLGGRWTKRVASTLGVSTSRARRDEDEIAQSCEHARRGRWIKVWRAAGYKVRRAPMPYVWFCVLESARDRPGVHGRAIAIALSLYDRSVHNAVKVLLADGLLLSCPPSMPGHGVTPNAGLMLSESGQLRLERALWAVQHG